MWQSTWETEAEGSQVGGQPRLYSKFEVSLSYIVRFCLKNQNRQVIKAGKVELMFLSDTSSLLHLWLVNISPHLWALF